MTALTTVFSDSLKSFHHFYHHDILKKQSLMFIFLFLSLITFECFKLFQIKLRVLLLLVEGYQQNVSSLFTSLWMLLGTAATYFKILDL